MTHEGSEGLCLLLKRNRNLEMIRTSSTDEFVDFPTLAEMQKLNPRIRWHVVSVISDIHIFQCGTQKNVQSAHRKESTAGGEWSNASCSVFSHHVNFFYLSKNRWLGRYMVYGSIQGDSQSCANLSTTYSLAHGEKKSVWALFCISTLYQSFGHVKLLSFKFPSFL